VRESVFSILGDIYYDLPVLDLYAGTGSLGLEALSRGASSAIFVEKDRATARLLEENIGNCGFSETAKVVAAPVKSYLGSADLPAELAVIFADPPYLCEEGSLTLKALSKRAKSLQGCLVVLEHASAREVEKIPGNMIITDQRKYGDTAVMILEFSASEA
jgi:16S rRNA (guanine(966)-N(2))-methyltransferase RsmD